MKSMIISFFSIIFRIFLIVVALVFVIKAGNKAYSLGYRIFAEPAVSSGDGIDITVTIPMGSDPEKIGEILEDKGLIRDGSLFKYQERLSAYHGELQSGTYTLNTSMTAEEMMKIMADDEEDEEEE